MKFTADLDHSQQQNNIDLDPDHTILPLLTIYPQLLYEINIRDITVRTDSFCKYAPLWFAIIPIVFKRTRGVICVAFYDCKYYFTFTYFSTIDQNF
jgi:hypothetical protein